MSTLRERPAHRRSKRSSWFLSLLLVLCCRRALAQEDGGELLLMAVRVDRDVLADSISVYARDKSLLLPLGELCRLVQFAIAVDATTGKAQGFFVDEQRRFRLDVVAGEVVAGGKRSVVDPRALLLRDDDIYVDASLLAAWFPFDIRVDRFAAMIALQPREKLPFQLRRERERAIELSLAGLRTAGDVPPFMPNPYASFTQPFIDQQITMRRDGGRLSTQYATLATGDLLDCHADLFVAGGNQSPLDRIRLTLGRRDPNGTLAGPLHAREAAVGDVLVPGSDLVTSSVRGDGILLSSFPLQRASTFREQTLSGDLPPGWDVELYLNGALIAFQDAEAGRYEFRDVPVNYGFNVFRLVFHGPHGEVRQKIETHEVGETLTPPGTLYYRIGRAAPLDGPARVIAEASYGVSARTSVAAFAAKVGEERYAFGGWRATLGRVFAYADAGASGGGGRIARAGAATQIGGLSIAMTAARLGAGYASETYSPVAGAIASRETLRLGGVLFSGHRYRLPVTFDLQRDTIAAGGTVTRAGSLLSTSWRRMWISNRIDAFVVRGVASPTLSNGDDVSGTLLLSRGVRGLTIRGETAYALLPRPRITTTSLRGELPPFHGMQLTAELTRLPGSDLTKVAARLRSDRGPAGVVVSIEVPSRGAPAVVLQFNTSLMPNPLTHRAAFRARPAAQNGAVAARVFVDRNGNGLKDDDEPPIEHAGFFVGRNSVDTQTGTLGVAMLGDLPADAPTDVRLSAGTLDDPWWLPARPAVRMIPRAGKALVADFPVVIAGEVTGNVRMAGNARRAIHVRVQLVDGRGAVVRESASEYDGFYDITAIPPGAYTLRIAPDDVASLHLASDAALRIAITPEKNVLQADLTVPEP